MIYLALSILFSTLILIAFRLFKRFSIDTFQAIVFNYIVAFVVGFSLYGDSWKSDYLSQVTWIPYAVVIGILFISLFLLMGKSTQENGMGVTSVTVKMSLAIPVIMAVVLYDEQIYWAKILGVIGALLGVFLLTYQKSSTNSSTAKAKVISLVVLFFGSGLLDTLLNYVEKKVLFDLSPALFSAIGFGIAGCIGLSILFYKVVRRNESIRLKNVLGGIGLGIPNYFSIYFLIMAIRYSPTDDSITYALNNVGIVVASFIVGVFVFKEVLTKRKIIGGIIALFSLILLTFF